LQQNTPSGIDTVQQSEKMKVGNKELPTTMKTYNPNLLIIIVYGSVTNTNPFTGKVSL
jgi:hypothetical protein